METFIADECEVAQAKCRLTEVPILGVLIGVYHVRITNANLKVNWVSNWIV